MTDEELERIEDKTGVRLPDCYKHVVLNYPKGLLGTEAEDYGLLTDPEQIIAENLEVRHNGYFGELWPDRYFIVGQNGLGDYYVIKPEDQEFSVGFVDHEQMVFSMYASNLEEFVQKYLREIE